MCPNAENSFVRIKEIAIFKKCKIHAKKAKKLVLINYPL